MLLEKAAMFVDNSNIFKGMYDFSRSLIKKRLLRQGQYLRIRWDRLIDMLQSQEGGIDIFARHFFASLPPAADVSKLRGRPSEEQWKELIKKSAQSGFYKTIQEPPFDFVLHAVPLRFAEIRCGRWMRAAYYRCLHASDNSLQCGLSLDPDSCYKCERKFVHKYEKGVDVALAAELVIFCNSAAQSLERVLLTAGDGDYKEAIRFVRRTLGKDVQIVSWRRALLSELQKIANKETIVLDDHWENVCEVREKPPLEEAPVSVEEEVGEEEV